MIECRPYLLRNKIQNYEWGTKNENAFIPRLIGLETEPDKPYAELWLGAHPKASSEIKVGENWESLESIIEKYPIEILGKEVALHYGNKLPFLLKVLSAGRPLSIQTHPTREQAKILHATDPDNYPDENHKPEIAIALDHLSALVGFKPFIEIREVVLKYDAFRKFMEPEFYSQFLSGTDKSPVDETDLLKQLYAGLINSAGQKKFMEFVDGLKNQITDKPDNDIVESEKLFLEMLDEYGYDIGLVSILFFNLITLNAGEAIFTAAGIPHAYIGGNIIECMANSDNVIRAGLTPKFKDVSNLLKLIDYTPAHPKLVEQKITGQNSRTYITPAKEFEVMAMTLEEDINLPLQFDSPAILIALSGYCFLETNNKQLNSVEIISGTSVLIPAKCQNIKLTCKNKSLLFIAYVKATTK